MDEPVDIDVIFTDSTRLRYAKVFPTIEDGCLVLRVNKQGYGRPLTIRWVLPTVNIREVEYK